MNIEEFLDQQRAWLKHNFPSSGPDHQLMGIVEEVGELTHAILKSEQKIRGTEQQHEEAMRDAIGDILIYSSAYCITSDLSVDDIKVAYYRPLLETQIKHSLRKTVWLKVVTSMSDFVSMAYGRKNLEPTVVKYYFTKFIAMVNSFSITCGFNAIEILSDTWNNVVAKRDWRPEEN